MYDTFLSQTVDCCVLQRSLLTEALERISSRTTAALVWAREHAAAEY